jgi:hypothetical protein
MLWWAVSTPSILKDSFPELLSTDGWQLLAVTRYGNCLCPREVVWSIYGTLPDLCLMHRVMSKQGYYADHSPCMKLSKLWKVISASEFYIGSSEILIVSTSQSNIPSAQCCFLHVFLSVDLIMAPHNRFSTSESTSLNPNLTMTTNVITEKTLFIGKTNNKVTIAPVYWMPTRSTVMW